MRPRRGLQLALVAAAWLLLLRATLNLDPTTTLLTITGAWALLGLWLPPQRWRQSTPLAIAAICALPLGAAIDLYLGFPLRLATAHAVAALLDPWLPGELASETIIVIETGHANVQVDLPCSGVRSLYAGALLWAAASWIEHTRIDIRWCARGLAFAAILVACNFTRVVALVLLHAHAPTLVQRVLHLPLGALAFAVACTLGWLLLRRLPHHHDTQPEPKLRRRLPIAAPILCLLTLALLPAAAPSSEPPRTLALMLDDAEPVALAEPESRLFRTRGAEAVGKWNVVVGDAHGQLLMVRARSWRAQHRPDVCHRAGGRRIEHERSVMLDADTPVRVLRLRSPDGITTGVYWFQSASLTTDDHGARVWSALGGDAEPWVMVSLVLAGEPSLDDPDVAALLHRVHDEAARLVRAHEESPT